MNSKDVLIIWHSRTGGSKALARSVADGAGDKSILTRACDVSPGDILNAGAYVFVCPENLASMSGEMKEMFDRCYYPVLGSIEGRAYATIIAAGSDGQGAQRQIDRIALGWRLKRVIDPWIVNFAAQTSKEILAPKLVDPVDLERAFDLGAGISEAVRLGIY